MTSLQHTYPDNPGFPEKNDVLLVHNRVEVILEDQATQILEKRGLRDIANVLFIISISKKMNVWKSGSILNMTDIRFTVCRIYFYTPKVPWYLCLFVILLN